MTKAHQEKQLFRIPEVEEYLGVSRAQVYRLIESGELKRIKLGKSARIPRASIESFVERLEAEGSDNV